MTFIIVLEHNGEEQYWSQYGGFTTDRITAMEFSQSAAERRVSTLRETAKHPQYSHWANAKMERVSVDEITTTAF